MLPKERSMHTANNHQLNEIQIVQDENTEALKALFKLHIIICLQILCRSYKALPIGVVARRSSYFHVQE
jgi:hypothetical protein